MERSVKQDKPAELQPTKRPETYPCQDVHVPLPRCQLEKVNRHQHGMTYRRLFKHIKNTNMPKKLLKMFKLSLQLKLKELKTHSSNFDQVADQSSVQRAKVLTATLTRLKKKNIESTGIKDLTDIFCGSDQAQMESRKLMKSALSQLVLDEVLRNDNIPQDNKYSYLKCLKTMEWRMRASDDNLVARVQSKF